MHDVLSLLNQPAPKWQPHVATQCSSNVAKACCCICCLSPSFAAMWQQSAARLMQRTMTASANLVLMLQPSEPVHQVPRAAQLSMSSCNVHFAKQSSVLLARSFLQKTRSLLVEQPLLVVEAMLVQPASSCFQCNHFMHQGEMTPK